MGNNIGQIAEKNCHCNKIVGFRKLSAVPWVLSIFIAVLPKCPFCIFGYSSVMVLCSGARVYEQSSSVFQLLPQFILLAVAGSFWWNYKGRRTWWALGLTTAAGILLASARQFENHLAIYYAGSALIFFAVFVNGPLLWFWTKTRKHLNTRTPNHPNTQIF